VTAIADESRSAIDVYVREGCRKMLQSALESEVQAFLEEHAATRDERSRRRVVRNGYLPARSINDGSWATEEYVYVWADGIH